MNTGEVREIIRTMSGIERYNWIEQLRPATGRTVTFYGHDMIDHELVELLESRRNNTA